MFCELQRFKVSWEFTSFKLSFKVIIFLLKWISLRACECVRASWLHGEPVNVLRIHLLHLLIIHLSVANHHDGLDFNFIFCLFFFFEKISNIHRSKQNSIIGSQKTITPLPVIISHFMTNFASFNPAPISLALGITLKQICDVSLYLWIF